MDAVMEADPVRSRVRARLGELFGTRFARAILFGSRARGDAAADSDYDVAVFLKDMPSRWADMQLLAGLEIEMLDALNILVEARPFHIDTLLKQTPLMFEIREDGRDL